jgi:hypothetical protein
LQSKNIIIFQKIDFNFGLSLLSIEFISCNVWIIYWLLKFASLFLKSSIKFARFWNNKLTVHISNNLHILFTLNISLWLRIHSIAKTSRHKILKFTIFLRSLNRILLSCYQSKISSFLNITIEIIFNNALIITILRCLDIIKTVFLISNESYNKCLKNISILKMRIFFINCWSLMLSFACNIGWHSSCLL